MQISTKQMKAFARAETDLFEKRMMALLNDRFPESKKIPRDELLEEIHNQIEKARSYNFRMEPQVADYIIASWLLGPEFDNEFPAAKAMLNDSNYTAIEKSDWLKEWTHAMFETLEKGLN